MVFHRLNSALHAPPMAKGAFFFMTLLPRIMAPVPPVLNVTSVSNSAKFPPVLAVPMDGGLTALEFHSI